MIQLNWIQIPLKKNEMMQIDGKGTEDLVGNMVLENNNLKDTNFKTTTFHASLLVNGLFEIVQMMTYDLWNLKFSHRNQFDRFLSLELIKVPSILRLFFNKPLKVAHHHKNLKLWRLPNIKIFTPNVNTSIPIFVHSYRFQKDKDG